MDLIYSHITLHVRWKLKRNHRHVHRARARAYRWFRAILTCTSSEKGDLKSEIARITLEIGVPCRDPCTLPKNNSSKSRQLITRNSNAVPAIVFPNKDLSKKKVPRTAASAIRGYRREESTRKSGSERVLSAYPKKWRAVRGRQGERMLGRREGARDAVSPSAGCSRSSDGLSILACARSRAIQYVESILQLFFTRVE